MPLVSLSDAQIILKPGVDRSTLAKSATAQALAGNGTAASSRDASTADSERMRLPYGGYLQSGDLSPSIITSTMWAQEGKYLALHAGFKAASWTLPLRAGEEEVKGGHARFASPRPGHDGKPVWVGHPRVSLSMQSGNILPIPTAYQTVKVPHGLSDFYYFLDLMNQPPLVPSGDREGAHNYVWVFFSSNAFPDLLLKGYLDPQGTSWSEEAEGSPELNWETSLLVHESSPDIFNPAEMVQSYEASMLDSVRQF